MATTGRKRIDCAKVSQQSGCTLAISGTEDEVVNAAVQHAIHNHGMSDTPALREMLRRNLEPADQWRAA